MVFQVVIRHCLDYTMRRMSFYITKEKKKKENEVWQIPMGEFMLDFLLL